MPDLMRKMLIPALIAALALLAGCGGKSVKTDYYTLQPLVQTQEQIMPVANLQNFTLGLGPVTLPVYITSRAQIMAGEGPNKLKAMESARWAEPLDTNFTLVLADNLGHLLNVDNILLFPWRAAAKPDFRVEMTVFVLSADNDTARLRARCRVSAAGIANAAAQEIDLTEPVQTRGAAGMVAAQNRLLNRASVIVAQNVAALAQKRLANTN